MKPKLDIYKMVDYGIGIKTITYFKLMYICDNQLVIAIFGLN